MFSWLIWSFWKRRTVFSCHLAGCLCFLDRSIAEGQVFLHETAKPESGQPSFLPSNTVFCLFFFWPYYYKGLFSPNQWEASSELWPLIKESWSLLLALTNAELWWLLVLLLAVRESEWGVNVTLAPSASVIISYSELLAQDQPERASLSLPARFPAHQMDAPLLGVFGRFWCLLF